MRPGKRQSDDGDRESKRDDQMAERQPPARQQKPQQVADHTEGPGPNTRSNGELLSIDCRVPERQKRVEGCLLYTSDAADE